MSPAGLFVSLALLLLVSNACARDYFVSPRGDDAADGLTPATAVRSFAVARKLRPGDVLRLQRGGTWNQTLRLPSGAPDRPIEVTAYGGGELPTIDGAAPAKPLAICIDASASFVIIDSLRLTGAAARDRGAIMVWANNGLAGITIQNCQIDNNSGRAIWIAGEPGKSAKWILIDGNTISGNAGSGLLAAKFDTGWILNNIFTDNCRQTVDPWQAAIRVWSSDCRAIYIAGNRIDNGIHHLERGPGMGIHIDETGPGVFVTGNDIRHCDAAGVEVENTRGVDVTNNVIFDAHTGVFVYRAGHDHRIANNTIVARSQGIVLQGALAHGVDAGPEILVAGQLLTGNVIEHNIAVAQQWGSLKLTGGGERLTGEHANIVRANALGPERPGYVEYGDRSLGVAAELARHQIALTVSGPIPFINQANGDLNLTSTWVNLGAQHYLSRPFR